MSSLFRRLASLYMRYLGRSARSPKSAYDQDLQRARELIYAIDRGGIPLNPLIVNRIGRNLGIVVLASDPMAQTIARIRTHLDGVGG